ncbi:HAD-IA family hydrolase [Sinorhizobium medicae]|nr:HAD-IA family hydrolase [Sinorhizobium medicae]
MHTLPADAAFFDIRDTLGIVDRKGHLVPYRPSSFQLLETIRAIGLRIGLITNLPSDVSTADGFAMVKEAGLADFIDPDGFVTNHDAGVEKPHPKIYSFAAQRMGLAPEKCIFIGENLAEVIGAQAAGMRSMLKPFPPGREFLFKPLGPGQISQTSSGRISELILEEDHLIAKRIVLSAVNLKQKLEAMIDPATQVRSYLQPIGLIIWLTQHFIDPFHHRKEEEVLFRFALMKGLHPAELASTLTDHEQGRAYFRAMDAAFQRICLGDTAAITELIVLLGAFANLYKAHGKYEDDVLFKKIGDLLTDEDDAIIVDLVGRIGPADVTLYLNLIASLEKALA